MYRELYLRKIKLKYTLSWALVVSQLAEWLLPKTCVHSSNPVISKILHTASLTIEKTKDKKKRPGMPHLKLLSNIV